MRILDGCSFKWTDDYFLSHSDYASYWAHLPSALRRDFDDTLGSRSAIASDFSGFTDYAVRADRADHIAAVYACTICGRRYAEWRGKRYWFESESE